MIKPVTIEHEHLQNLMFAAMDWLKEHNNWDGNAPLVLAAVRRAGDLLKEKPQ